MKKIIFLLCFCFLFSPAFSMQDNDVKNEVKRVKLEAKQKVEQIKTEAKLAKLKAKEDAKQAKIDAKNARITAAAEAKMAEKEAEFNEKLEDIKTKNNAKKAKITEIAKTKIDKINTDANAKLAKLEEQNNAAIAALRAKYESKKPTETVKAKKIETKTEPKDSNKEKNKNNADTDSEILPVNELKPRVMEKKPVINSGANFETKKTEIMNELNLTEKQRISAEKIYNKNRDEIAAINIEMENAQKELITIKKADLDTKTKERHISTIQTKLGDMYQTRDSVHNAAMKKFDNILDDEQKEIWLNLKIKGARLFPDIEGIK